MMRLFSSSHRPVLRQRIVAEGRKTFVALGDWIRHFSFLYYENDKFFLAIYRRGN